MHQRMILCVLYRLFTNFYANVAFSAINALLLNRKYRKYCVIIVSKPKVSINIVWTLKKIAKWKLKQIWLNLETNNKRVPVRLRIKKNISLRKHNLKGHCLVSRDSVKLCPDLLVFFSLHLSLKYHNFTQKECSWKIGDTTRLFDRVIIFFE